MRTIARSPAVLLVVLTLLPALASAQGPGPGPGGGGFAPDPLSELNLTVEPAGPLSLEAGGTAQATLVLRNDGTAPLSLNVSAFAGGGGGFGGGRGAGNFTGNGTRGDNATTRGNRTGAPPGGGAGFGGGRGGASDLTVVLESATGTVAAGGSGTDAFRVTAASNATAGQRFVTILVRDAATNRSSIVRVQVDITDAAAGQAQTQGQGTTTKSVPMPALGASIALAISVALARARRR